MDRKSLYLLRHAKSSWDDPGLADHDRPLAPRGRRATKLLARHIRGAGIEPALALCSSARRARETLDGILPALGDDVQVQIERELYAASAEELLERLRGIPGSVASAMLIGHNPSLQELCQELCPTRSQTLAGSGEALERIERKYPTGALTTLEFSGSWPELEPGAAELTAFIRPKDLR